MPSRYQFQTQYLGNKYFVYGVSMTNAVNTSPIIILIGRCICMMSTPFVEWKVILYTIMFSFPIAENSCLQTD